MTSPLFIQHRAPFDGHAAAELLDALLVSAAFGQNPTVLFHGDGVWQLIGPQEPAALGCKSLVAQLEALPLYDVENILVEQESLDSRGLSAAQLALPVRAVSRSELPSLLAEHSPVLRF